MSVQCSIGVDLGGQSVKLGVVDGQGVIRLRRQAPVDAQQPAAVLVELIGLEVEALTAEAHAAGLWPSAIGLVMPGYMDRERTRLTFAANLPTLNGTSFLEDVRARLGGRQQVGSVLEEGQRVDSVLKMPVVFDADSNAAALAEATFGAGRGVSRLIVVTVGTGIGGGVIVDGEILRVREHIAGSLGHMIVDARGPRCKCGARGCIEALAAGPALERRAGELADARPGSALAKLRAERGRLTGVEIAAALEEGCPAAQQAVAECGWWLGAGVASWLAVYAPQLVLIAGGIAMLGEPLLAAARRGLQEVGQPTLVKQARVELARLGADAGVIGAAVMAMK